MSVQSAAGRSKITVTRFNSEGADICITRTSDKRSLAGAFENDAIEQLINELAAAIGKDVTLSDPPAPKLTLRDLEPGTAFRFGNDSTYPVYVKLIGDLMWSNRTERIQPIGNDSIREVFTVEEES